MFLLASRFHVAIFPRTSFYFHLMLDELSSERGNANLPIQGSPLTWLRPLFYSLYNIYYFCLYIVNYLNIHFIVNMIPYFLFLFIYSVTSCIYLYLVKFSRSTSAFFALPNKACMYVCMLPCVSTLFKILLLVTILKGFNHHLLIALVN